MKKIESKISTRKEPRPKLGLKDRGEIEVVNKQTGEPLMIFKITKTNQDLKNEGFDPIEMNIGVVVGNSNDIVASLQVDGQFYPGAYDDNTIIEPVDADEFDGYDVVFRVQKK